MTIAPKSWWICIEEGPGLGLPHMVVMVNNRSVDAWSDSALDPDEIGNTWTGSRARFLEAFESMDLMGVV